MAPTSSPPREDPSSEVLSTRQRQLAPTVGPEASGGRNREGSAMGSYDDSIAVGRVLYAGNFPIVPPDKFWIPARSNPVKLSIVPIGGIHIFIGETVDSDGNALVSNADASAAELDAVAKIRSESQELPKKGSALDQEKSKPTQSAPEQEKTVEDQCRSAWVSQVLEKQRCHFVHFLAHTAGDALHQDEADPLQVEGPGNNVDLPEAVGDSDAPGQEEAGNPEESILGNLSPNSDDASSIGTEEYNRLTKELAIGEEDDGASSMNTEEFNRKLEELGGDLPRHHPEAEVRRRQRPEIRSRSKSPGGAPRDARDRLNEYRSDYIGPRCFGRMIREEPKPRRCKLPGNLKHYDGSERPDTWIEDYYNAVTFAGGTPNIACRMLQLYLIGPARVWLSDLEENTIFCWLDLKKAFENHFRGTYKRPATTSDLQACIQKKGETSRSFLTRWLATINECENVDNRTAMHAFIGGLQRGGLLRHKLTCLVNANKLTLDEMINIASDHTAADDDAGGDLAATAIPLHQQKKNRDNGVSNSNKRKNPPEDQKAEDPTWSP
ncbi:hypothetical protein QYE76_056244 [Lolium multiflorum]|uniref:Retrotransposon gag domain-containing protein n=1 Tax=Lolium multiflorum TaxID=4521 RepID=A0AAD8T2M5_LOLMU|nr:hypothetical protein QYE76_056244 [Lolium multiflorum]